MNKPVNKIKALLQRQFPRSFLIQKPLWGTLGFFIILFFFVVVYHPLRVHGARSFSFSFTVLFYCLLISVCVLIMALMIKRTNCFSKYEGWTVSKELLSIILILITIGLSAYFLGFLMEDPASRWNLPTFLDSFARSVLIGVIPVLFPSLLNIRYAFTPELFQEYRTERQENLNEASGKLILIRSKAKKEELSFYPAEFIYAESEGNYVVFHLIKQNRSFQVIIRNSMSEIEQQLAVVPYFMRIHRAFIVNLKKVGSRSGNSLGYRLKLEGSDNIIPVSRQNTREFDQLIRQFLLSIQH